MCTMSGPCNGFPSRKNPDFKPVRNAVIQAAVELDVEQRADAKPELRPAPPAHGYPAAAAGGADI